MTRQFLFKKNSMISIGRFYWRFEHADEWWESSNDNDAHYFFQKTGVRLCGIREVHRPLRIDVKNFQYIKIITWQVHHRKIKITPFGTANHRTRDAPTHIRTVTFRRCRKKGCTTIQEDWDFGLYINQRRRSRRERGGWFRAPRSFIFTSIFFLLHTILLFYFSLRVVLSPESAMSLHSFSPTSQLLHSNAFPAAQSPPPTSVFATNKGIILADFVGLYCKSRRARPRIGVSGHRRFHKFSAGKFGTINAVLDLDRIKNAAEQSSSRSDSKPKVCESRSAFFGVVFLLPWVYFLKAIKVVSKS